MTAAGARMTMRCAIQRDSTAGYTNEPTWGSSGFVQCFVWASAGREAVSGERTAVVEDLRALVPLGSDIKVADRISGVTDRLGATIEARPLGIETILKRADHLELILQVVES